MDERKLLVLVAPLDWGLGHATRCIPIIQALLAQNCSVILAGEGKVKSLLENEFPMIPFLDLPGYRIKYTNDKWLLPISIVAQIPKILNAIRSERDWLEKIAEEFQIDAVISDNRFGFYHRKIPSVFITHQLLIKAPIAIVQDYIQELNYQYINQYIECWVPDNKGNNNLAGDLSHPNDMPGVPVHYIGPLSRFNDNTLPAEEKHLFVLLSGPEPQRTNLEKILKMQIAEYTGDVVFVRGLPGEDDELYISPNVSVYNHLPAEELENKMRKASMIISRCGYSTVMDIAALNKKSILIPTPGQTEQEYLGTYLQQKKLALCVKQGDFNLQKALTLAEAFRYKDFESISRQALSTVVSAFINKVRAGEQLTKEEMQG
ncbi:MAG TPA: glycosyltransferase [Flavisolibacter sp.]|nr:glycosyltransferase [Flavisolibacter sp.]